jgi:hypothetical protein
MRHDVLSITILTSALVACALGEGEIGRYDAPDASFASMDGGELDATRTPDATAPQGVREGTDERTLVDSAVPTSFCELGEASSAATEERLSTLGYVVYFAYGTSLPRGRYRARYVGGCMKMSGLLEWTVQTADPEKGWWLVSVETSQRIIRLPGVSYSASGKGYRLFADCVAASVALPPVEFDFAGGPLGIFLHDSFYLDNVTGPDGANPAWALTFVGPCPRSWLAGADEPP